MRKGPRLPDPAWKAGFVSKSDSYKAWIGTEEAKQTTQASRQWQIKFQLSGASGRWPDHSGMKLESLPRSRFRLRRIASKLARRFAKIFRSLKRQRESD